MCMELEEEGCVYIYRCEINVVNNIKGNWASMARVRWDPRDWGVIAMVQYGTWCLCRSGPVNIYHDLHISNVLIYMCMWAYISFILYNFYGIPVGEERILGFFLLGFQPHIGNLCFVC